MKSNLPDVQFTIFIYVNLLWILTCFINLVIWYSNESFLVRIPLMILISYLLFRKFDQQFGNLLQNFIKSLVMDMHKLQELYETKQYDKTQDDHIRSAFYTSERIYKERQYIVGTCLIFGHVISSSILLLFSEQNQLLIQFGLYLTSNVIFHLGEFMLVCFYHFEDLCWNSFQINHSHAYKVAFCVSQIEFWIGYLFLQDSFKTNKTIIIIGILASIAGHVFRIGAFLCAKSNFHHLVQRRQAINHTLVTTGVYSVCRHPSYLGFFLQALGGQFIIFNPVCIGGYSIVLWNFFYDRIYEEEYYLEQFFGQSYSKYREKTGTLIPLIDRYLIKRKIQCLEESL